jgi:hypothetical protein
LTVALIAAYLSLSGKMVDVVSSNRDLAIDGERKCKSFFEFLALYSDHNIHFSDKDK